MKKKILAYILLMLPAVLMTSCLKDQDDTFSESATLRSANYLANVKEVLMSSENGWILNYYPDREQSYGGFVYTLKFDKQNVTVGFELAKDISKTITTTYMLDNEDGPVISFDTYNDYLHFFSTPTSSSGAGGYEAYDGDFIFIIMNVSEDKNTITLKGNRTGNIMYMHRLTGSDGEDYLDDILELKKAMPINYMIPDGADMITASLSNGVATFEGEDTDIEVAFHYTNNGIEFYEPITIQNHEITGITYAGSAETYPAMGDETLLLYPIILPLNVMFANSTSFVAISNVSEAAQEYFYACKDVSDDENELIAYMFFYDNALNFISGTYKGTIGLNYNVIGEDKVKFEYDKTSTNRNGNWYYDAGYKDLIDYLESTTFTISADSEVNPSYYILTDDNDETKYFKLELSVVYNPFEK